jgi:hypothetical protein
MKLKLHRKAKQSTLRQRLRPNQVESRHNVRQTFSYHNQRSDTTDNTGRKLRKQVLTAAAAKSVGNFWIQRFGLAILLIAGAVSLLSALSLTNSVKMQEIGPVKSSTLFHNQTAYQASADTALGSSVWSRNKVTINTSQLSSTLLRSFPELSSATVTLPLLSHRPIVYISYTEPAIIIHNQTGSFVLDNTGKVLVPTNTEAVNLGLPTVTDLSGIKLAANAQVLSGSDISFIRTVVAGLHAKQVASADMTLPAAASELDVAIAGKPYFVKFNLHANSAKLQIGSLLAVQQRLAQQGIAPSQYIDVRVDGRAYYK